MKNYWITVILCILVLTSSVTAAEAETKEFVVYSENRELSLCGCQTIYDSITIYNMAESDSWYKLEVSEEWIEASDSVIFIGKGDSKPVKLTLSAPCGVEAESYSITITSLSGYQRVITKKLNIETCQNLKVALVPSDDLTDSNNTINPCEKIKYKLYIQNAGPYQEEYSYVLKNNPTINGTVLIDSLQTEIIDIEYKPVCDIYGKQNIVLDVQTTGSGLSAKVTDTVTINQNYDFSLAFPAYDENKAYLCKEDSTTIPLRLINLVGIPNNYSIYFDAPAFISISEEYFELGPNEEKIIDVVVNPEGRNGEYSVNVDVKTGYGDAETNTELKIISFNCYDFSIETETTELYSCEDNEILFTLINNADVEQTVTLTTHEIAELDVEELTLGAGESKPVVLTVDNPKDDQEYYIYLNAFNDGKELAINTFKYGSLSDYSCTKPVTDKDFIKINYDTTHKSFKITNEGLQFEKYYVSTEGPEWAKLSEDPIELFSGETKEFWFSFEDRTDVPEGDYGFIITLFSENTEQSYDSTITIQLKDKSDLEKAYDSVYAFFMGGIAQSVMFYLLVILIIMIVVLIVIKTTAPKYPYKVKNKVKQKKSLLVWLIVLFIAVVVTVYLLGGDPYFPQAQHYLEETDDSGVLQWAEDTQFSFNISEYVSDPDMDLLELEVSELDHMESQIVNGVVTFIPEKDWYGEEYVFFIATDVFGQSSTSEIITLRVVDVPEFTFWDYFKPFIWTVNLLIFLFILTVFFFMFIVHNRRKKVEKNGKNGETKKNSKKQ